MTATFSHYKTGRNKMSVFVISVYLFADDVEVDMAVLARLRGRYPGVGQPRRDVLEKMHIFDAKMGKANKLTERIRRQLLRNVDMFCVCVGLRSREARTRSATNWRSSFDPNDAA